MKNLSCMASAYECLLHNIVFHSVFEQHSKWIFRDYLFYNGILWSDSRAVLTAAPRSNEYSRSETCIWDTSLSVKLCPACANEVQLLKEWKSVVMHEGRIVIYNFFLTQLWIWSIVLNKICIVFQKCVYIGCNWVGKACFKGGRCLWGHTSKYSLKYIGEDKTLCIFILFCMQKKSYTYCI